jgi:teichuronic acid biosynthesis protein TuaE
MIINNINVNKTHNIDFFVYILFIMIILMCTNVYFQLSNIPVFVLLEGGLLFYIIFRKKSKTDYELGKERAIICKKIFIFLIIWLSYSLMQLLLVANNWAGTRYYIILFINISTFIIIVSMARNLKIVRVLNKGIIVGLIINLFVAFWEIKTNSHIMLLTPDYERWFYSIPITFFSNANDLSTFLFFSVVILTIELILAKSKRYKLFLILLLVTTTYIIVETKSRGGINGIIIYFSMYLMLRLFSKIIKQKRDMLLLFSLLMFFLSTVMLLLAINSYFIINSFSSALDERLHLWSKSFQLFVSSYFMGIGPGQNLIKMDGNVHFFLLEILSEYGIFIILGLMIVFLKLLKLIYPFINSKLNSLIASFVIAFIPISISSSSITKIYPVWIVVGIIYAVKINFHNEKEINSRV